MQPYRTVLVLSVLVLSTSVFFGGATRTGFAGDVVVQLLAIPLLLVSAWAWLEAPKPAGRPPLLICLVLLAGIVAFAIQLILLPLALQPDTPPHLLATSGLALIEHRGEWARLSLTPHETWASASSLIAPIAIFMGTALLNSHARLTLFRIVLALGGIALLLAFLQIAQGPESALRFYEFTNRSEAVGFFANRNHFAAQLYITLVFSAAWFATSTRGFLQPGAVNSRAILQFAAALAFVIAIVAGLAMARSRAGVFLAMVAIVGVLLIAVLNQTKLTATKTAQQSMAGRIWLTALGFAVVFAAQFGLTRILTRFDRDPLEDLRIPLSSTTLESGLAALPFGTGIGSFVPVYAAYEKSGDLFRGYANRAHNDFAELVLETGAFGIVLIAAFVFWVAARTFAAWFKSAPESNYDNVLLRRAATIAIALLLAHSFVDYPLRTTALATIFSFCCALLVPPPLSMPAPRQVPSTQGRQTTRLEPKEVIPATEPVKREQWRTDIEWPESWTSKPTNKHRDKDT